ncbi:MAG: rhodanese-related sulfurtransferase [Verrucomicrobiota bacterium]
MEYQILLYYKYTRIVDPEAFARKHLDACRALGLRGRILVASEGLNGTVSGTVEATNAYIDLVRVSPSFHDMQFKIDVAEDHAFQKMFVRPRTEIVTLGLNEQDVDPNECTGKRLSPVEFLEAMENEDVVILDGRNDYESDLGYFEGAIAPRVRNFRDFPEWIRENLSDVKDKKVLTYCTGGIRCEKLSGFLIREGFQDVSQLEGGIVTYGKDPEVRGKKFKGKCYVFDERIGVDVNSSSDACLVSHCQVTGKPTDRYVNCAYPPCNRQFFISEEGEAKEGRYCSDTCKEKALANSAKL